MLLRTFIRILTSLIRDFCTSDRNFASTFFQIPPHDGHPWSWLVVGHCDHNPHNRLSLSRYMPCPAYVKAKTHHLRLFASLCCLTIASASSSVRYNLDSRTRVPEVPQLPLPSKIMVQNPPVFRTTLAFLTKTEEATK